MRKSTANMNAQQTIDEKAKGLCSGFPKPIKKQEVDRLIRTIENQENIVGMVRELLMVEQTSAMLELLIRKLHREQFSA